MAGVAAVASIFATVSTISAQNKARRAAEQAALDEQVMAREEAAAIESETAESVRRARDAASKAEGLSRARAAGSGIRTGVGGSLDIALESMSEEHDRQIQWMASAGASRARMAIAGGEMRSSAQSAQADQFTASMWGSLATGVSSGYSSGADANWWS